MRARHHPSANRAAIDPRRPQCPTPRSVKPPTRVIINDQMARTRAKSIANESIQVRSRVTCNTNAPSPTKPRRSNPPRRRRRLNRRVNKARRPLQTNAARAKRLTARRTKTITNRLTRHNNSNNSTRRRRHRLANTVRRRTRTAMIDAIRPQASPTNVEPYSQNKFICK